MNVVIDIILALIVLGGAFVGFKRGFISTVAKPVKLVLCIVVAFSLASSVATAVIEPIIGETVENQISDYLTEKIEEDTEGEFELPTLLKLAALLLEVDVDSIQSEKDYADALVESIASPVIHFVAVIISFVLLYFALKIILGILLKILDSAFNTGIVGAFNKTLGLVFGTVLSVTAAWAVVSVFEFVINTSLFENAVWLSEFEGGYIYNFFKAYNPIDLLLSF